MLKNVDEFSLISQFQNKPDIIVFALAAKRNEDGLHITDAQKDAAMNAAKSVLQICGAAVVANSTAFIVRDETFTNETKLLLTLEGRVTKDEDTELEEDDEEEEEAETNDNE